MLRPPRRGHSARLRDLVLALLPAVAGCGADSSPADSSAPDRPPVVLIVIDTLRADHLSCYGYELPTSPVLDALAAESTLFRANSTQCNSTFPSITSILTGLYPRTHRNYLPVPLPGTTVANPHYASMAERLAAADYHSMAVVSHPSWRGGPEDGAVRRGWDEYSVIPDAIPIEERPLYAHGAFTNERVFALLDAYEARDDDAPPFLWAHYFDPHTDLDPHVYNAPPEYRNRFLRHHLEAVGHAELTETLAALDPVQRAHWIEDHTSGEVYRQVRLANGRALYDAEIASCDAEIGRLFERLRAMGLYDDALIVVMADHGENLEDEPADQQRLPFTHRRLYEPVAYTPLLVRLPGQTAGRVVEALSQNIDVLPTVVELLDLPPGPPMEGRSLVPLLDGTASELHERVFIESSDHTERAIRTDRWKYILPSEEAEPMLFEWRADPGEVRDRAAQADPQLLAAFGEDLAAFRPRDAYRVRFVPDEEPYTFELELVLDSTVIEEVEGAPPSAVDLDGQRLRLAGTVVDAPLDYVVYPRKRHSMARWSLRLGGTVPTWRRIRLGQLPLDATTAYPLFRAGAASPPSPAAVAFRSAPDEHAFEVAFDPAGLPGETPLIEIELRYVQHSYGKGFELVGGADFEPVRVVKAYHTTRARLDGASAVRIAHDPEDDDVLMLLRADGRWPALETMAWNGKALALEPFEFAVPFPLDGRLVGALLAGPDESDPPAGCVQIWLSGGGPVEFDAGGLDEDVRSQLNVLGYVDGDEDDE